MNEIYLKIYVENNDTLVLEGQGSEDKPGYYPTRWDDVAHRIGTVVSGAKHISITEDAIVAFTKIINEANHTGDDISCLDIYYYGHTNEVCVSYLGPVITKFNIEEVINDPEFFIGCGEGTPRLDLLNKLTKIK
jgi:hypothetical protein